MWFSLQGKMCRTWKSIHHRNMKQLIYTITHWRSWEAGAYRNSTHKFTNLKFVGIQIYFYCSSVIEGLPPTLKLSCSYHWSYWLQHSTCVVITGQYVLKATYHCIQCHINHQNNPVLCVLAYPSSEVLTKKIFQFINSFLSCFC